MTDNNLFSIELKCSCIKRLIARAGKLMKQGSVFFDVFWEMTSLYTCMILVTTLCDNTYLTESMHI